MENVAEAALETKVARIIDIRIRRREATAVEQIEKFGAKFERRGFSDTRFLQDTEVLSVERKGAQIAVSRCRAAEECRWIGIVSAVFGTADRG